MSKEQKSNKEARKPKAEKPKKAPVGSIETAIAAGKMQKGKPGKK